MELAKWLLPSNIIEKCSSKSPNSADCNFDFILILNSRITTKCAPNQPSKIQSIHLEIKKRQKYFDISITIRDEAFRNEFISHLQTKILVKMRYIYRELESKSGCEEITDESSSISSLFYSSISRFIS
ncbi:unnamed protein product [Anisakis simplex]|uniref:Uncharacterized protein n=1 Tax=Anisakis simplex TaxID=6269 RepID=A0A0M3KAI1_ANISI|nr:unnamed protein product [Anisakis simplex]